MQNSFTFFFKRGESISQQPTDDLESNRSMLAVTQPRTLRALGRTGHSYASIMAPTRNNVASGARSNGEAYFDTFIHTCFEYNVIKDLDCCLFINSYTTEFLTWTCSPIFWICPLSILVISRWTIYGIKPCKTA